MGIQLVGAVATITGVILGFALSQTAEYFKAARSRQRTTKAARLLLFLEVKKNYRLLSIYWYSLIKAVTEKHGTDQHVPPTLYATAIVDTAFPVFSNSVRERLVERMAESFSFEEISHTWDFYEDLTQLTKLHVDISDLRQRSNANIAATEATPSIGKAIPYEEFIEKAKGPVDDFIRIIKGIMDHGGLERIFSVEDKRPLLN